MRVTLFGAVWRMGCVCGKRGSMILQYIDLQVCAGSILRLKSEEKPVIGLMINKALKTIICSNLSYDAYRSYRIRAKVYSCCVGKVHDPSSDG